ncbi:hypothetical protein [uncultured Formosa sp.]|uniref:hypothetical protein n=1 Tax=uncultured Formosa sp. TaxID=255435 RepID=UPI002615AAE2|nr:hypothetical protein [uncultured Formosa sp.]
MKILNIIIFVLLLVSCKENKKTMLTDVSTKTETQDTQLKRYKVKSGSIKYKTTISGNVMGSKITGSGTERKYFKAYGAIELVEEESSQTTVANIFGNKSTNTTSSHTINKLENSDSYSVDFKQKKIYKHKNMAMELTKQFQPNKDAGEAGKNIFKAIGGQQTGTETYKGYDCEIWETMGVKQWIYKGVTLKAVGTLMGITTTTEATTVQFDIPVPDSNFKLPNFPIVEQDNRLGGIEFDSEDFSADYEDIQKDMDKIKNMSYEDWKQHATANDEEMQKMSEEELHETYNIIQNMIKMRE